MTGYHDRRLVAFVAFARFFFALSWVAANHQLEAPQAAASKL